MHFKLKVTHIIVTALFKTIYAFMKPANNLLLRLQKQPLKRWQNVNQNKTRAGDQTMVDCLTLLSYTSLFAQDTIQDIYSLHWNTIHKLIGVV